MCGAQAVTSTAGSARRHAIQVDRHWLKGPRRRLQALKKGTYKGWGDNLSKYQWCAVQWTRFVTLGPRSEKTTDEVMSLCDEPCLRREQGDRAGMAAVHGLGIVDIAPER